MTSKPRIIASNILIIFGFLCIVSGVVMLFVANKELVGIVSMFAAGVICIIVGGVLWVHSGHPTVAQPKNNTRKVAKVARHKTRKAKQPFMTEEEWKEQEEEDDEMMFIEEVVEED